MPGRPRTKIPIRQAVAPGLALEIEISRIAASRNIGSFTAEMTDG